jgi:uncharacterized protein (TIGR03437 family)
MLSGNLRFSVLTVVCAATLCGQTPTLGAVVNAASLAPDICPGASGIVQGAGFTAEAVLNLGGVKIAAVGGSVLPTRFNVLLPRSLAPGAYQATVTTAGGTSAALAVTVAPASPAFFVATREGVVQGAFFDPARGSLTTTDGGAPGALIVGYANGLGAGTEPMTVSIRGENGWQKVPATAQEDSSASGYWQARFRLPGGLVQGMHEVYLTAGGFNGPSVQLPVGGAIISAIVNSATNTRNAAVAPGSMVTISATSLAVSDSAGVFPGTDLPGGGTVRMGGIVAPLYDVSARLGQAHALVPLETPESGSIDVVVENSFGTSRPYALRMAATAVGIFRLLDPSNPARSNAAALIQGTAWAAIPAAMAKAIGLPQDCRDGGVAASTACGQPATAGDVLQVYCTGLGRVVASGDPPGPPLVTGKTAPADGSVLYRSAATPQVTVGGVPATVLFAGLAPGFAGLYQVDVKVPSGVEAGDEVALTIVMPAGDSDSATIAVR